MDLDQKWAHDMSLTQMSSDTLSRLERMCMLCVLAAVWPHTCTIRSCYLLWYMKCWTELSGSTFTKAIDLLFLYISLVNDKVHCHERGWLTESHSVPGPIIELNTFPLGLVGALPHVQSHCGVLYKLNWSQMIMKRSIKTFSYGFWGFIFFFCMLSRL